MRTKTNAAKRPSIRNATTRRLQAKAEQEIEKAPPPKKTTPKVDAVAQDRERLLGMAREAGLRVEERTAWLKITGKDKKLRVYVARRGPQVHLTFPLKVAGVEAISEAEARKRHIGSVRSIVHLDRQKTEVLAVIFKAAVGELS
jgi:hypothetical protein